MTTAIETDSKTASESAQRPTIFGEVSASLVVFLVAVPLSMGIALASGASVMSGLIAAAIGGIVVGALAGAPLQVSGPAAGLAVMVFGYVQQFGFRTVCAITVVAGIMQITLGAARVARVALVISPAVIHGMLAGIGIQITLAQLHVVLGGRPQSSAIRNVIELPRQLSDLHGGATMIGLVTIAIVLAWPALRVRQLKAIPAALVGVVAATAIALAGKVALPRVNIPTVWHDAIRLPVLPASSMLVPAIVAAITLTIVASAESLLSAVAADKLHSGKRANLDREIMAQGVGNALSGMVGGLPITGVIVRSTANISAGAKTRWSAVLHGVWIVVFVTLLGSLMNRIPLAALAGLLVVVGTKLVNVSHMRELRKHKEAWVYFATLAGVVGINLLAGIGIGVALAIMTALYRLSRAEVRVETTEEQVTVDITGNLTFLSVPKISARLAEIPTRRRVLVEIDATLMDHAAWETLHSWRVAYENAGGTVEMDLFHEAWTRREDGTKKPRTGSASLPSNVRRIHAA